MRSLLAGLLVGAACLLGSVPATAATTPIGHLVVIYNENVSFDHYFGTYPNALNPPGEPQFTKKADTPTPNGLTDALRTANPNAANPYRIARADSLTCDNNHAYTAEQQAFNMGAMDKFVQFVSCPGNTSMGYFDGNTVTALWNYAQQYTLSDNFFGTTFGPSTPGHINLISGNTHGATPEVPDQVVNGTLISGPDPAGDECGNRGAGGLPTISFGRARNIGTLLSAKGVTWGYFQGGFRPTGTDGAGGAVCASQHANVGGALVNDYSAHHEPFQYYDATRNPTHKAPASPSDIGHDDPAGPGAKVNHQYDVADFKTALDTGNVPAVSFIKPPGYQDGHAGYSSPVDEQRFLVNTINSIQASPIWDDTAIVIAYDDSDAWYDHVASPIVNSSLDPTYDALDGPGQCHGPAIPPPPVAGGYMLRCGFGPRLPLLAISPFSKPNHISHTQRDQTSILRFIEDNWATGQLGDNSFDDIPAGKPSSIATLFDFTPGAARAPKLALDPETGNVPVDPSPPALPDPPAPPVIPPVTPAPVPVAALGFTAGVKPKRDKKAPFTFKVKGKLTPAAGVACAGPVSVAVKAGSKSVVKRGTRVGGSCTWSMKLKFAKSRRLGKGRLTIKARFLGTAAVLPRAAKTLKVRAG